MYVATVNVWSSLVTQDMVYQMISKAAELNGDLADELDQMTDIARSNDGSNASYAEQGFQGAQTTKRYWVSEDVANQWIVWIKANFESKLISIEIV